MANIDHLVQDFLAQKIIAVVGVSDTRETGANLNYKHSSTMAIGSTPSIRAYPHLTVRPVIPI